MAEEPTVSIITPCFNGAAHLRAAIESILSQDYPKIDYLVMDGGSSDDTVELLRSFGSRVRWISEPDRGQAHAINTGFSMTHGDILGWLNADDVYAPGAVRAAVDALAANPSAPLVYGNALFVDAAGNAIAPCAHIEPFSKRRLVHYSDFIVQPAAFFRRADFEAVGGLDERLNWTLDYDLWLKLADRGTPVHIPNFLAHYRWLGDSKTATGGWPRLHEISRLLRERGAGTPAYVQLECVNAHLQDARAALRGGAPAAALAHASRAAWRLAASPRAVGSLFSGRTWKIIYTGQVLRTRALAATTPPAAKMAAEEPNMANELNPTTDAEQETKLPQIKSM